MTQIDADYKASEVAGYADVPQTEKERLFDQVKSDPRFADYLYGCYECGICVAVCPATAGALWWASVPVMGPPRRK